MFEWVLSKSAIFNCMLRHVWICYNTRARLKTQLKHGGNGLPVSLNVLLFSEIVTCILIAKMCKISITETPKTELDYRILRYMGNMHNVVPQSKQEKVKSHSATVTSCPMRTEEK